MSLLIRSVLAVIIIAYPFVVYFGLLHFQFWQVALFIVVLALFRILLLKNRPTAILKTGIIGAVVLLFLALLAMALEQALWLKIYPVAISLLLLFFFASSLLTSKSMIERFAELREKNITKEKQHYMRNLTKVWCGFFVINAMVASYTIFQSDKIWMLYNGLISYLLMGGLLIGELFFRHLVVLKRHR
ncbi:MAG: hypothetical protein R3E90_10885 [Marinicella sp.]|nr:hypothetical protein [Xanthomonadales bacterium]